MPRNAAMDKRQASILARPKRDHDIAFLVVFINVMVRINHLIESIAAVDERREFPDIASSAS